MSRFADFIPGSECPCCGKYMDAATGANCSGKASPGDLSICFGCGAILRFKTDMRLELVPKSESDTPDFADARRWQERVRFYQQHGRAKP